MDSEVCGAAAKAAAARPGEGGGEGEGGVVARPARGDPTSPGGVDTAAAAEPMAVRRMSSEPGRFQDECLARATARNGAAISVSVRR